MAGITGSNVDFSWLGELPGIYRESQDRSDKKATLADLSSTDPDSLEKKAGDLIRRGFLAEGLSLQQAALARRTLTQKGAADAAYAEWIKTFKGGAGAAPPPADTGNVSVIPPAATAPPPPASLPSQSPAVAFPPPPSTGPRSALPMPQQAAEAPPSPTEQILAQAEGGGPAPLGPGPQLAGPPPTPDTPPGLSPATVQGALARPAPALPTAAPVPPAPSAAPGAVTPAQAQGQAQAVKVGDIMLTMPPGSQRSPAFQMFMAQFRNALAKQNLSPEMTSYQVDNIQSIQAGNGPLTHAEWKANVEAGPGKYKDTLKDYGEFKDAGNKSQGMLNNIAQMDRISKDPNFVSGLLSGKYGDWINKLSSLAQIAGVASFTPKAVTDIVNSTMAPHLKAAALREQFESLSNSAVLANAGSLSKGFSEGDRIFTAKMFASAANTPGGIAAINEQLAAIAKHNVGLAKVATEYMADTEKGAKSTPWGLQKAIDKYNAENPLFVDKDGNPTALAKKVEAPQQAAPTQITPAHEGKTGRYQDGSRFIIRNGKPEPYNP